MPGTPRARRRPPPSRFPGRAGRRTGGATGRLAVALLVSALVGGGAAYLHLEKRVTLVLDGQPADVRTFGVTVGDLLERQGIVLGPHDHIVPAPATGLWEGMHVRVQFAKEITLVLDGHRRTVWITGEKTVEDVLDELNVPAGRLAYVRPGRGATVDDGDVIVYRPAVLVRVTEGGRTDEVITNAPDVATLLDSMGLVLRRSDRVQPGLKSPVEPGMEIRVVRVRVREITVREEVAFQTRVRYSDDLYRDQQRVQRAGVPGLTAMRYRVRIEDGAEVHRQLMNRRVIREPVDQIVVKGTRPRKVQEGVASWYERTGLVAAHPSLPFGTRVAVTNVNTGRSVTVVINDRGPYIGGRIIDLSDDAFARIAPLSRGTCPVRITW